MNTPYNQSSFDQFRQENSSITTSADGSTTIVTSIKRSNSRKNRIRSQNQTVGKISIDDLRTSRTQTASNRISAKLPSLSSNPNLHPGTSESIRSRYDSQSVKNILPSSPGKLERQTTTISSSTRLPTLYSLFNADDQKRTSILRRRQIYALNHLMRELEQEQFRQYCQLHNIGSQTNSKSTVDDTQPTAETST